MMATLIFTIAAAVGTGLTTLQAILAAVFRRRMRPFGGGLHEQASPPGASLISILKPVCGLDDELEDNLVSFVALRDVRYEMIISIAGRDDPAVPVVQRVMRKHPKAPFKVIIGSGVRSGTGNRKVERLVAAARVARGDILFVSDSNVRVNAEAIAKTVEIFRDPRAGCVSNVFTASGAKNLGARIESLHLLAFVFPGAVLAATAGVPCVVGKSMAISRRAHDAIGGFAAFRHVLAEDQAIALAVRRAGFDVLLSPVAVQNVITSRTLRAAVDRQIRWNKIRYSFSPAIFSAEVILNPLPFAAIATFAGGPPSVLAVVLLARFAQLLILRAAAAAPMRMRDVLLAPMLDALMLYTWFVPFFSNEVTWRGYRAKLARNTELVQVAA